MFIPKSGLSSAASLRNPRRRQRTSSDESVKAPNAKRQRSALRQGSSVPLSESLLDSQKRSLNDPTAVTGDGFDLPSVDNTVFQGSIPIRGLKKSEASASKIDETVVLSKTDLYTVSQLPNLPDQIRASQSEFRGFFGTENGYALALTKSHAIIWPYLISTPTSTPPDVFTLAIPESCRDLQGPVPLGVFLSNATGGIPGLMVVIPNTGRIIYWETISNAGSLGLPRQKETGLRGYISGLLPGEHATDVINCEPSGVVVTFSSGRVAHITLRDSQARPTVMVNFLRSSNTSGGILGGIKSVFGNSCWRKDVAAVKAGRSHQRGQRDIIIATSSGVFEVWDTHWSNGSLLKKQFDVRQELCSSLGRKCADGASDFDLKVLDFSPISCEDDMRDSHDAGAEIWRLCLVAAPSRETVSQSISVVQIVLSEKAHVVSATTIGLNFTEAHLRDLPSNLKIFVPKASHTAFIVIGQSVILLSLSSYDNLPTSQLLEDSDSLPPPFHDQITFRTGEDYKIVGSGFEGHLGEEPCPTCLVMIRNFGIIRITAASRQDTGDNTKDAYITAKTKLEQAVFYGTKLGNPLNLTDKSGFDFPPAEIEQAALEICEDLLRSTSSYIPTTSISLDQNLRLRSKALEDLAALLLRHNKPLRRQTWFELLWSAEKLAAQRALWKLEDGARRAKGQERTFLARVIDSMNEKFKTKSESQTGDDDVRDWFLYDTFRMEHIVPWIFKAIKPQKGNSTKPGRRMIEEVLHASELSLAVLETAFRYRDEHACEYGLDGEYMEDGVLMSGYDGLSEFWTSREIVYIESGHLLDIELDTCRAWIQQTTTSLQPRERQFLRAIAENSSRQLRVLGLMHCERVRWLSIQDDPKLVDESIAIEQAHTQQRRWRLFKLAGIGQLEHAITLAENFRDMGALVELIIELQDHTLASSEDAADALNYESEHLSKRISTYFERFGESWADAFFARQVSMGQSGILFTMRKFQPFVTRFLHKYPAYARLCWINDAIGENDYEVAARSLETLAIDHESDIWSHRVELSLSKLAKFAALEKTNATGNVILSSEVKRLDDLAELDAIQEVVHDYIAPALGGAIDQKAEVDLAMDQFGQFVADMPSLREVLRNALTKVITRRILGVDELVDVLTLIDGGQILENTQSGFSTKEFYLALRVIRLGSSAQGGPLSQVPFQKLVWRRCMIRDDWQLKITADDNVGDSLEDPIHKATLCRTLSLCLKDRHCADTNSPPTYIPPSPLDVMLSESDLEIILSRFPPEQRSRISRDLSREDEVLHQQIREGKLEFWFKTLLASTEEAVTSSATASTSATGQLGDDSQVGHADPVPSTTRSQFSWL